jgi:hypothetical protein
MAWPFGLLRLSFWVESAPVPMRLNQIVLIYQPNELSPILEMANALPVLSTLAVMLHAESELSTAHPVYGASVYIPERRTT